MDFVSVVFMISSVLRSFLTTFWTLEVSMDEKEQGKGPARKKIPSQAINPIIRRTIKFFWLFL